MKPVRIARPTRAAILVAVAAALVVGCGGSDDPMVNADYWDDLALASVQEACALPEVSQLSIATENAEPITDKDRYRSAVLDFSGSGDPADNIRAGAGIRGRGNTTWHFMPKKPYKVKLDSKTRLFGMPAGKSYAVLANYADKSMLRTQLAFCLAEMLHLPYTPKSHFVELTLNGSFDGLYQYTNKVYEITDRIDAEFKEGGSASSQSDSSFDEVFLLEIDARSLEPDMDPDKWFLTASGIPYKFRSKTNPEHRARITGWFDELESILADREDPDRLERVRSVADLGTLIDYYLLSELTGNPDSFYSSTYVYRTRGGLLTYGPIWDFDMAAGNADYSPAVSPRSWHVLGQEGDWNWYFRELLNEREFALMVQQRWAALYKQIPDLLEFIDASALALDAAQGRNFERWPILDKKVPGSVLVLGSYAAEVDFLRNWLADHAEWMNENIADLDPHGFALQS